MATIGLLLSPRGLGLFMAMMILARLGQTIDLRLQIAAGFLMLAASSWWMSSGTSRSPPRGVLDRAAAGARRRLDHRAAGRPDLRDAGARAPHRGALRCGT